jgi:hypothetical protein
VEWADSPSLIPTGWLDLDDVGAQFSEKLAAEQPSLPGQIQDAEPAEQ